MAAPLVVTLLFALAPSDDALPPAEPFELPPLTPSELTPADDAAPDGVRDEAAPGPFLDEERRVLDPEPFARQHGFAVAVAGKGGYSLGHVWNVPYTSVPTPGVGVRGRYRLSLAEHWRLSVDGTVSIGGSDDGSVISVGSYRATIGVGHRWLDLGWLQWWTTVQLGFESFLLIPVPLIGVANELTLLPIRWSWLVWSITGVLDSDLYVVVPSLTASLSTAVVVPLWFTWVGFEVVGEAQAIVAGVANAVGASAQARVITGFAF